MNEFKTIPDNEFACPDGRHTPRWRARFDAFEPRSSLDGTPEILRLPIGFSLHSGAAGLARWRERLQEFLSDHDQVAAICLERGAISTVEQGNHAIRPRAGVIAPLTAQRLTVLVRNDRHASSESSTQAQPRSFRG